MLKFFGAIVMVFMLIACGKQQAKEIREIRTIEASPHGDLAAPHGTISSSPAGQVMPPDHPPISPYVWELPSGWVETSPTSMRIGNFKIQSSPATECYITIISGSGGGVAANVNRWRQQMEQPALDDAGIAALPTIDMLGRQAVFVEIEGDFTGMSGQKNIGFKMLGAQCPLAEQTLFVKMTGPASVIEAEKEQFKAFCASLREGGVAPDASLEKTE